MGIRLRRRLTGRAQDERMAGGCLGQVANLTRDVLLEPGRVQAPLTGAAEDNRVAEGCLEQVLNLAARKGDERLAEAAWEMLNVNLTGTRCACPARCPKQV